MTELNDGCAVGADGVTPEHSPASNPDCEMRPDGQADALIVAESAIFHVHGTHEGKQHGERLRQHVAAMQAQALRDAAGDWLHGEWAHAPRRRDRVEERIANAQHVGDWLLTRADRLTPVKVVGRCPEHHLTYCEECGWVTKEDT